MHILIAPNAFKHSLDAEEAAAAISEGFIQSNLDCTCESFPIADGGDGTGELIIKKCNGVLLQTETNDPIGRKIKTSLGLIDDGNTAVIEMATSSGIKLLQQEELNPLVASSFGTGEQIIAALGCRGKENYYWDGRICNRGWRNRHAKGNGHTFFGWHRKGIDCFAA
jgi:glycerate kinase